MASNSLSSVQSLLNTVAKLRDNSLLTSSETAPNFNLFRILGVESHEVSTHSAFIGHLLTPSETHAQGDFFLRGFLTNVTELELIPFDDWAVTRELPFDRGRLDIVLRSSKAEVIIVIENKIDTQDSEGQLAAYRRWLDVRQRRNMYKTRLLLYLTPNGDEAKHASGVNYEPISYTKHITKWLSTCQRQVEPHGLKSAIGTYLKTIQIMNAKTLLNDDLDDKVLDFLDAPGNQDAQIAALRIARIAKTLRENVLKLFWIKGETYLKKMCIELGFEQWDVRPDSTYSDGSFQGRYALVLGAKNVPKGKPRPEFWFNQFVGSTLFRWEWGVKFDGWQGKNDKIRMLPDAVELTAVMGGGLEMPRRHSWDGYQLFTDDLKGIDRTLEDELKKQTAVSEYFEGGWEKFRQLEPHLRKLYTAVVKHIK